MTPLDQFKSILPSLSTGDIEHLRETLKGSVNYMGEVRQLPAQTPRVETGAIQFEGDWPGLFVRGDNAFALSMTIRFLFHLLERVELDPNERTQLAYLKTIREIIDEDVRRK